MVDLVTITKKQPSFLLKSSAVLSHFHTLLLIRCFSYAASQTLLSRVFICNRMRFNWLEMLNSSRRQAAN